MTKIIKLEAENIKRLSAVQITPDGSTVVIGGRNGQGKSSVLDAIWYAMGGQKAIPSKPLRRGAKQGSIRLDLGELIVERTFTADGKSALVVKSKDGYLAPTPQQILNDMCGKLAFDPLSFARLKPKEQLEQLKELVGLDFSALDAEYAKVYATRTDANRRMKQKQAELSSTVFFEGLPDEAVSVSDKLDELKRRESVNRDNAAARKRAGLLEGTIAGLGRRAEALKRQIKDLQQTLSEVEQEISLATTSKGIAEREAALLVDEDLDEVRAEIRDAGAVNEKISENRRYEALAVEASEIKAEADRHTERLKAIDDEKAAGMAGANFPVPGLGFDAEGITFDGLPFEQAANNERIRVSVAMGMAMNPDFRVMLIHDGSLLDDEALGMVVEAATGADYQVWIERVGVGQETSVVIEDGQVSQEGRKQAALKEKEQAATA